MSGLWIPCTFDMERNFHFQWQLSIMVQLKAIAISKTMQNFRRDSQSIRGMLVFRSGLRFSRCSTKGAMIYMECFGELPYDVGYQKKHVRPHGEGRGLLLYPAQPSSSWLNFFLQGEI